MLAHRKVAYFALLPENIGKSSAGMEVSKESLFPLTEMSVLAVCNLLRVKCLDLTLLV